MIQFEMPRQQRYQLVADDESDMPEWAEEYTICNLRSGSDPGPYMFCGGEWVMLSSYAVSDGTLKIYHDVKAGDQPWDGDASEVKEVVIADTVKSIGAGAFSSLENLEHVSIPAGVEVEDGAFSQTFKDPFDVDVAMADVAGYEYAAYEGVMYQCDPEIFTYSSNGSSITGLSDIGKTAVTLVIPATVGNIAVTGIANGTSSSATMAGGAFTLVLHTADQRMQTIGNYAFLSCTSLASMDIPDSVTSIGDGAFRECTSLASVNIPDSVTSIGTYVFDTCTSLASMDIPDSVTSIGDGCFRSCTGITEVSFADEFAATLGNNWAASWTFYAADGTTVIDKTVASNLAGKTFKGSASRLVEDAGPVPGMEGRYMYAITTDSAGMNILSVQAGHDGRPLDTIVTASTRRQGAENIPKEWDFVNGVGPFKCWYGAFNIQDYVAGTETEAPVCTGAGMLAYRLDPYDLGMTMAGTTLQGAYNVFLVVPAVYWKAVGDILYLSDDSSYAGITGMTAYAHTATLPDTTQSVYPFIGIGVYEASDDETRILSVPRAEPAVNHTNYIFKGLADGLVSAGSSDFQQINFFHWTLFKMMCYTVMGTKNCQWMMGDGPVYGSAATATGQSEKAGPYAQSTAQYDKLFIENSWGDVWALLGDTVSNDYQLRAGNQLGGMALTDGTNQPEIAGIVLPSSNGYISECYLTSEGWDAPKTVGDNETKNDPAFVGDTVVAATGLRCLVAGGRWDSNTAAGVANCVYNNLPTFKASTTGGRLSAFFDGTAMGTPEVTTKAAPAPSLAKSIEEDLSDQRDEPAEEPEEAPEKPVEESEEPVEEPVAEESEEGVMDIEGQ